MDAILAKYYSLTPKQRKVTAEKFLEILNENEETRKKSGKKSTAKFKKITKLETERDTAMFNRLRAWRNQTAESMGLDVKTEAWQIMKNDPLMNVAYYRPASEEEFLRIEGMNEETFSSYGQQILDIVAGKNVSVPRTEKDFKPVKQGKIPPSRQRQLEDQTIELEEDTPPPPGKWFLPPNK